MWASSDGRRRVTAELDDVGGVVVGHPHSARRDRQRCEPLDALAQVHAEALHRDAMSPIGEARVQLVLQRDERLDIGRAGVLERHGGVLDVDEGEDAEGVVALRDQLPVLVARPRRGREQVDQDRAAVGRR
jgi:hypothetical protein